MAPGRHNHPMVSAQVPPPSAGADVGPEERASTAGSPFAFEGDKVAAGGLGEWEACTGLLPTPPGCDAALKWG